MEMPILFDIVIILALSVLVIFIFSKLRIPNIVGFLLTGMIAGPHALSLIGNVHQVELIAEIGVIMLLFIIGLEFSLKRLSEIKKIVLIGGGLQVLLTVIIVAALVYYLGLSSGSAIFTGFLFSLSSTAIVLQLLQKRDELNSPHGKTILAVLIFQDIIVVPMMLFTPMLNGEAEDPAGDLFILLLKGLIIIGFVLISARYLVPGLLYQVARTQNRELFMISIVVICFAVAWLTSSIGLSLALGAFLAGLIISESEYSYQAMSHILPFQELFTSIFFISIGMLFDISFLFEHPLKVLFFALLTLIGKAGIAGTAAFVLKLPLRTTILVGLALSQVGEFAFILSKVGLEHDLMSENLYQYFLSVSIVTMSVSPFIINYAHSLTAFIFRAPFPNRLKRTFSITKLKGMPIEKRPLLKDHLVIIGFGINGKNVAKAARMADIPYLAIELNADEVEKGRAKGEQIFYGDAAQEGVLEHARVKNARVVVVAISDIFSTRKIVAMVKRLNPSVFILVRTRYVNEVKELYRLGADEIIPEEFETSIEIFTRVLMKYLIPKRRIEEFVNQVRADSYEMLRNPSYKISSLSDLKLHLADVEVVALAIRKESELTGKSLKELHLPGKFDIYLLAIKREETFITNPPHDARLEKDDVIYIFGSHEKVNEFAKYLQELESGKK